MKAKSQNNTFEHSYNRLEKIMELLEDENISLEDTLKFYEEALTLTKTCKDKLENAELRIKEITKSLDGNVKINDFK